MSSTFAAFVSHVVRVSMPVCLAVTGGASAQCWSPLGSGMGGSFVSVSDLAVLPNGDLVAGGAFTTAGGVPANNIAGWDGSTWSPLGSGIRYGYGGRVSALAVLPNGDLVAGGDFISAGNGPAGYIARWDGGNWSPLGSGMDGRVSALTVLRNGDLVAGGWFTFPGGRIARWDGSTWSPLGSGISMGHYGGVLALAVLPNGDIIAGGSFSWAGGVPASCIARWDGSTWSPLGSGLYPQVSALTVLPNGDLVAGGLFTTAGGVPAKYIARWDGSTWSPLGSGVGGSVSALTVLPNGDLVAGGGFTTAGGVPANNIARWDGSTWSSLSSGVGGGVGALALYSNGEVVAGGAFTAAGGLPANNVARWDAITCVPGSFTTFGAGCAGVSGAPFLSMPQGYSAPRAGQLFTMEVNGLPLQGSTWMVLGVSNTTYGGLPLPLDLSVVNMPGCTLYGSAEALLPLPNVLGVAVLSALLPPSTLGGTFYAQAIAADITANPTGLIVSDAAKVVVGG